MKDGKVELTYSDNICPTVSKREKCRLGEECMFCHNFEEISYHPARFKTKKCNKKGCKGEEICSYAHETYDERIQLSTLYKLEFSLNDFSKHENKINSFNRRISF